MSKLKEASSAYYSALTEVLASGELQSNSNLNELVHDPELPFVKDALLSEIVQRYWRLPDRPSRPQLGTLASFESRTVANFSESHQQCCLLLLEIQQASMKLIDILQQCAKDQAQLSISRSLRSHIRSLPVEILCYIFGMCISSHDFDKPAYVSPLLLGQVCKYWRDVVANEASLWTHPRVRYCNDIDVAGTKSFCKTLRLHRELAKASTLELSFAQSLDWHHKPTTLQSVEKLDILSSTLRQCKELRVSFDHPYWTKYFSRLDAVTLNLLECLFFKFHITPIQKMDFSPALRLRSVRLYTIGSNNVYSLSFPPTLKNLSCCFSASLSYSHATTVNDWRSFLVDYPNLQRIEVYFSGRGWCDKSSLRTAEVRDLYPVTFSEARSLLVRTGFQASLADILCNFSFPNLEELQVVGTSHPTALVNPNMALTTMPYIFTLTSLRLIHVEFSPVDLRDLLTSTRLLTSLDIMMGRFCEARFEVDDTALVSLLMVNDDQAPILPRLRDLWLYFNVPYELSEADTLPPYANMAASRYEWASHHIDERDAKVGPDRLNGLPSYPFRLHLKYEKEDGHFIPAIAEEIGPKFFPVLFPEVSVSFTKEL